MLYRVYHAIFRGVFLLILLFSLAATNTFVFAQPAPFSLVVEPIELPIVAGRQSYAIGQYDGKWLLIGGRKDGLHRRQPFAAFDAEGQPNDIVLLDPISQQQQSVSINTLPTSISEQLNATNLQYYQEGNFLLLVGGYGYSPTADEHLTYNALTIVDLPKLIQAIQNDTPINPCFYQILDDRWAVTGGKLLKIDNTYYLVGGHRFEGRYNPMGPDHGPGFVQQYTNEVRRFGLHCDSLRQWEAYWLSAFADTIQLHRRDLNVVPQIYPNGKLGLTAFSGVFQYNADIPYLSAVDIDSNGYAVVPKFAQYYNHYHCPILPLYSALTGEMHTVFFGGIAQYYDQDGLLVQDNNVPFVRTIARVTRYADGSMKEYKMPIEMPDLLGAAAEFIPVSVLPMQHNVVLLDSLPETDTIVVGYILGGIKSQAPNIFFTSEGEQSQASTAIYVVKLYKTSARNTVEPHQLNAQSNLGLQWQIYPSPTNSNFIISFYLDQPEKVQLTVHNSAGKQVISRDITAYTAKGRNRLDIEVAEPGIYDTYTATLQTTTRTATQKIIVAP